MSLLLRNKSLVRRGLGLLRKYGADAHVYIPGIGSINGLQAGNYLESTASTAATVDGLAGFVTDAFQGASLGPDKVTNGDFSNGTTGWNLGVGSGSLSNVNSRIRVTSTVAGATTLITTTAIATVVGGTYKVLVGNGYKTAYNVFQVNASNNISGSGAFFSTNAGVVGASSITDLPCVFTATATTTYLVLRADTGASNVIGDYVEFDNVSVREVPGIHATQGTTGYKPDVRQSGALYYHDYDGIDDRLSLGSVPFQMADDHLAIFCAKTNAASGTLSSVGSSASNTPRVAELSVNASGYAVANWVDDAATASTITGSTDLRGVTKVYEACKQGNNKTLHIDGVQIGSTDTTALSTTTVTTARIGATGIATPTAFLNGNLHAAFFIKGTVPDSERAIFRKFAGLFGGLRL